MQKKPTSNRSAFGINSRAFVRLLYAETFTYSTVRSASIDNKLVAVIYRMVQVAILSYIIGFDIIWNKGYQVRDIATSTVTTKVKGLGYITDAVNQTRPVLINDEFLNNPVNRIRVFDTSDYIVPPNEFNSLFLMTNFIETQQKPGKCEESVRRKSALCQEDSDCRKKLNVINTWSGIPTGKCLRSAKDKNKRVCEIVACSVVRDDHEIMPPLSSPKFTVFFSNCMKSPLLSMLKSIGCSCKFILPYFIKRCPVEEDPINEDLNLIQNTLNFTIFIKNDVDFKKFSRKERNILPWITNSYISGCNYHKENDKYCPVFLVDYILKEAEPDAEERLNMLRKGGVVLIEITWNCNYDLFRNNCMPVYSFKRFDLPFKKTSASSGFNFRFANKFVLNGTEYRTLYKAFGLRFIVSVSGTAGKFSVLPLMLTIGAGLGLMSISVIIADCVMLNFTEKKKLFQKLKELDAKEAVVNKDLSLLKEEEKIIIQN